MKKILIIILMLTFTTGLFAIPKKIENENILNNVKRILDVTNWKIFGLYECNCYTDITDLVTNDTNEWYLITTEHVDDYKEKDYPVNILLVDTGKAEVGIMIMHKGYKVKYILAPL